MYNQSNQRKKSRKEGVPYNLFGIKTIISNSIVNVIFKIYRGYLNNKLFFFM